MQQKALDDKNLKKKELQLRWILKTCQTTSFSKFIFCCL